MELPVFNGSDVASDAARLVSDWSNVTAVATSASEMNASTRDGVSSIPSPVKKLFSEGPKGIDARTESTTLMQIVNGTTTYERLNPSTDLSQMLDTSQTFINTLLDTVTPTMNSDSDTSSSSDLLRQKISISTDSVTTASTNNQSTYGHSSSSLFETRYLEESTMMQLTSSQAGINEEITQQTTEHSDETRSWVSSTYQDVSHVTVHSQSVSPVRFPRVRERDMTTTIAEKTFTGEVRPELSTDSSPFFHDVFSTDRQPDPASLSDAPFTVTNTTIPPVTLWELANGSSNVTHVDWQYPSVYDVIMDDYDDSTAVMAAKTTTLVILAVAGVVGNAMVIWSVVRQRHLHRPPFYYLLSLSLTDLSRAAFCLPLVLMTLLQGSVWRHGNSACDLFAFANAFFVLSSGVSLLDIAADRHLSLVYSRSYRRRSGGVLNLVVVLLGWSLAFLVAFPPVVGVGSYAFEESEGQCTLRHRFFRHNNDTLGFLMVFTALMLVTLFLYYRILVALRAHRKMRPLDHEPARSATWTFVGPGANGQAFVNWVNGFGGTHLGNLPNLVRNPPRPNIARVINLHVARNQHVTRLFFLMTLAFNALWLPYQVLSYWRVFGGAEGVGGGFATAAAWLSYGQVVVCPVVYFSSRGAARPRPSRADLSPQDKQEYLLESVNRKK